MSRWQPWDVIDGAYADETRPWSSQDTVNYLLVPAEQGGTASAKKLVGVPGLDLFCDLNTGAPVRGTYNADGTFLAVSGDTLFRVSTSGVATDVGTIPGVGRVSMSHNKLAGGGNQIAIATGNAGYVYSTVDGSLVQITDAGFPGATTFDFVDGYITFTDPFGRFWAHSELQNALSYSTLDRSTAESAPDPIVGHIVSHGEVCVFGTRTCEFYRNTGETTGTFQTIKGAETEVGLASPYAVVRLDNTVYWLGSDGLIYRYNGHTPEIVSNGPIASMISGLNLANAFAFTWEDRKHKVVYFTFPDGPTVGFDVWTGRFHRRESYGMSRWRINTLNRFQGDDWIAGDFANGRLYKLSWRAMHEYGDPLVSRRIFPASADSGNALLVNGVKVMLDTGVNLLGDLKVIGNLPDSSVGTSGSYAYEAKQNIGPVQFSISSGSLPPGAALGANGVVTFEYTTAGTYSWIVRAEDSYGNTAELPDEASISVNGPWFYGPVAQNGSGGGSTAFYKKSADPTNWSGPPIALPMGMADLGRISTANGVLFFHGASITTMARVSFDGGESWSIADRQLSPNCDVYWNGTYYFNGAHRSLNGIAWSPIPGLLTTPGAGTAYARESDGAVIVSYPAGSVGVSTDNGDTWTVKPLPFGAPVSASVESNGTRVCASIPSGSGFVYTDNLFTTQTSVPGTGFNGYVSYFDGVWIGRAGTSVRRSASITAGSFVDVLTSQGAVGSLQRVIEHSATHWASLQFVGTDHYVVQVSDDGGISWAPSNSLYGPGGSIAFPRDQT